MKANEEASLQSNLSGSILVTTKKLISRNSTTQETQTVENFSGAMR